MAAEESRYYELGEKWSPPPAWARNKSVSHRFTEWCIAAWQDKMWTQSAAALSLLPAEHAAPSQPAVARYYRKVFGSKPVLHGPMHDVKKRRGALRRTVAVVPVAMLIKESYAVLQSAASGAEPPRAHRRARSRGTGPRRQRGESTSLQPAPTWQLRRRFHTHTHTHKHTHTHSEYTHTHTHTRRKVSL